VTQKYLLPNLDEDLAIGVLFNGVPSTETMCNRSVIASFEVNTGMSYVDYFRYIRPFILFKKYLSYILS
jgi:hypothetical protein